MDARQLAKVSPLELIAAYVLRADNGDFSAASRRYDDTLPDGIDTDTVIALNKDDNAFILTPTVKGRCREIGLDYTAMSLEELMAEAVDWSQDFEKAEFYRSMVREYIGSKEILRLADEKAKAGEPLGDEFDAVVEEAQTCVRDFDQIKSAWPRTSATAGKILQELVDRQELRETYFEQAEQLAAQKPLDGATIRLVIYSTPQGVSVLVPTTNQTINTKLAKLLNIYIPYSMREIMPGATVDLRTVQGMQTYDFQSTAPREAAVGVLHRGLERCPLGKLGARIVIETLGEIPHG